MIMKWLAGIAGLQCCLTTVFAQEECRIMLDTAVFTRRVATSALFVAHDSLFMVQERCSGFMAVAINNMTAPPVMRQLETAGLAVTRPVDIEGAVLYGDDVLLTDEANTCVYSYSLVTGNMQKVQVNNKDMLADTSDTGLEGIAVNEKDKICYLLKERDGTGYSYIYVFGIAKGDKGQWVLDYKGDVSIYNGDARWRYTDLYFDNYRRQLFALKSFYIPGKPRYSEYVVDVVPVELKRLSVKQAYAVRPDEMVRLSDLVKGYEKGKKPCDSNLEGMVLYKNKMYLVSDNSEGAAKCDNRAEKSTLLLRIDL